MPNDLQTKAAAEGPHGGNAGIAAAAEARKFPALAACCLYSTLSQTK